MKYHVYPLYNLNFSEIIEKKLYSHELQENSRIISKSDVSEESILSNISSFKLYCQLKIDKKKYGLI